MAEISIQEMKLEGIAEIMGNPDIGIVRLVDTKEKYLLPMVCSAGMKEEIGNRMRGDKFCRHMLPEVLAPLVMNIYGDGVSVIITELVHGNYMAVLEGIDFENPPAIYAIDAILLHLVAKVPIFVTDSLLKKQAVPFIKGSPAMALPLNVLTPKMLKDALDNAVQTENYEMASKFRDELKNRESK